MLKRLLRLLIGIMLIPVCFITTRTAIALIKAVQPDSVSAIPPAAWAFVIGYIFWLFLYFTAPRPVRTYVLAHELTHALWGLFRGAEIHRMKVSKNGGSVTLSKTDFLITLAPYFFPLYAVLVVVIYYLLSIFWNMDKYYLYWLGLVGFTWGFHFTFTISSLLQRQSDIQQYGHLFSYVIIYLFNIIGIGLWTVLISSATIEQMFGFTGLYSRETWAFMLTCIEKSLQ